MTKIPKTLPLANEGLNQVSADFNRIGWGAVPNPYDDVGIDLFLLARDFDRIDRGLLVGAQVKSGTSYFESPSTDGSIGSGWYYAESSKGHLDHWLNHALPQIIVLFEPETRQTFWRQITANSVEDTGLGWKILIPSSNRVDQHHFGELMQVATSRRMGRSIEGSIWSTMDIAPSARWRHALLAPRMVSPHRNKGSSAPIDEVQALALVVERRLRDLERFAQQHETVPSPDSCLQHDAWGWRFVGVVQECLAGRYAELASLIEEATDNSGRAAALAFGAASLRVANRHRDAHALLEVALKNYEFEPVDRAWLMVHRSLLQVEYGAPVPAHQDALSALGLLGVFEQDVTASALAGAAASLVWETVEWQDRDLATLISASDNAVSWWRDQSVAASLAQFVDESFTSWEESSAFHFAMEDSVVMGLEAAFITAQMAADHSDERINRRLMARCLLMARGGPESWLWSLETFRGAGDRGSLESSIPRALGDGPVEPVKAVAESIGVNSWTRTSIDGNLAVWERAADVMSEESAAAALSFCTEVFTNPSHFMATWRPVYALRHYLLGAATGLISSASLDAQEIWLTTMRSVVEQLENDSPIEQDFARSLLGVSWEDIDPGVSRPWCEMALTRGDGWSAFTTILAGLYETFEDAANCLIDSVTAGNWWSLNRLRDPRVLSEETVHALSDLLEARIRADLEAATGSNSSYGFGGIEPAPVLAWLNSFFPALNRWDAILEFLKEEKVLAEHKASLAKQLAVNVHSLEPDAVARVRDAVAGEVRAVPLGVFGEDPLPANLFLLRSAVGAIDAQGREESITKLLSGSSKAGRAELAEALGFAQGIDRFELGVLVGLLSEDSLQIRLEATQAIARQVSTGLSDPAAIESVTNSLSLDSVELPFRTLAGFSRRGSPLHGEVYEHISNLASASNSSKVRRLAHRIISYETTFS